MGRGVRARRDCMGTLHVPTVENQTEDVKNKLGLC